MENTTISTEKSIYAVPLVDAVTSISSYKRLMVDTFKLPQPEILKAFTIQADELLEVLGLSDLKIKPAYPAIRVYLGKKDGDKVYDMKLFLTPVNEKGRDVILGGGADPHVFDFNLPCPNTCDTESPLYQAS